MEITQEQVDALLHWIENRKAAYLQKGLALAAKSGVEQLSSFADAAELSEEDTNKSLAELRAEMLLAEEFYKDARQMLYAGRQGG
ncbi:hypothetical protein A9Q83_01195 [Alphaproteobacteria bacterium 46_93_T64]|nr:hypothetical protein A9Q83_01195 [Alphaproteobacteria bacterium 46_93_T64]